MSAPELPSFPPDFLWGTSTAAYQIEGAVDEDGRGRATWDQFCAEPGRIADGSSGEVACDHYHRYAEDIALMQRLGTNAYRFSIAWPRIQPDGRGPLNPAGLAFYDRLVDAVLAAGVTPFATLFHWDLPQPLEDDGGWLNRETALRFGAYAETVAQRFTDRVGLWAPVNEPNVLTVLGYALGQHAPGRTLMFEALPAAHHLLLGHGLAVQALRAAGATRVGCAANHTPVWPATADPADLGMAEAFDTLWNWIFADPILLGRYPEPMASIVANEPAEDLATIAQPLDFYGVNYYYPTRVGAVDGEPTGAMPFTFPPIEDVPHTDFGWPVVPDGLRELLVALRARYGDALPPIVITENGCSYDDAPDVSGQIADDRRIAYLDGHLRALRQAMDAGVDVQGYFCWSLLDNFEWAEGFRQRFGLVHVDFDTQVRTPRDSFAWYARVIAGSTGDR